MPGGSVKPKVYGRVFSQIVYFRKIKKPWAFFKIYCALLRNVAKGLGEKKKWGEDRVEVSLA